MTYLLILGDTFFYHVPNLTWEYIKAYFSPQYKNKTKSRLKHENLYEKYKEEIKMITEGSKKHLSARKMLNLPDPPWLDLDKLKNGQEFAKSYYFPICYSNLISLFLLFAHDRSLRPLIYTRRSDATESAYRRYMSTIHRVKSWYEDDLTDPASLARKHIQTVNKYHLNVSGRLNSMTEEQFKNSSNLDSNNKIENDNNAHKRIRKVIENNNIQVDTNLTKIMEEGVHVSQSHMAVTQFGFMGLIVLYPKKFGIEDNEELDSFIHMWQYIGYLLGIEDEYNLCYGTTIQVKRNCTMVLECVLKPCMLQLNSSWEHMSICAFQGINRAFKRLIFETTLAFLLYCIDLKFDYFYNTMSLDSRLSFHGNKFLFSFIVPRRRVRLQLNSFIEIVLEKEKHFSQY